MSELTFRVDFVPPYSVRHHEGAGGARRGFWLEGRPVVVVITQEGDDGLVTARAFSNAPLEEIEAPLREAVRLMIAADDDLKQFHKALAHDPPMRQLAERLVGLKPLRIPDLWTALLRALLAQQAGDTRARATAARLARRFGPIVRVDGKAQHVLPDPETVLGLEDPELAEAGLSERKCEYAREIAREIVNRDLDPEDISRLPSDKAVERLVALRGVGMWTAECTAIFCLGEEDVLPADDPGLRKAIAEVYGLPRVPAPEEARTIGERWKGWRSYAAIYLWRSRDDRAPFLPE